MSDSTDFDPKDLQAAQDAEIVIEQLSRMSRIAEEAGKAFLEGFAVGFKSISESFTPVADALTRMWDEIKSNDEFMLALYKERKKQKYLTRYYRRGERMRKAGTK